MSYFNKHIFFCCNQRSNGEASCNEHGASDARRYVKEKLKKLGLLGEGKCRVSQSACLGRCAEGPVAVVYPQGAWFTYVDEEDLDEIVEKFLIDGFKVERLEL